ncbi:MULTISPECIES: YeiH family protein [unclassified Cryobacterium]|uniref:YeiH family protein n=1 Tax=unclassified Cryobacterium TaxID=2649013 RepID=UPI002AB490F1|nr:MULTISPECIES: putative sulfate exporter family transporter [unclassified Cryobacterium]MDY7542977.1 putative sulfate exporter family transporter [Cryobacterium sp. 5B3]MEA9999274.1 putative sulfate exporter family transporter [Cryobacterium sp. RTS3]MEB0265948.1 putative sulfate exporter family transporter [Cryobacterium sp. 10I5]MEB0274080.1 putative sulfate exporter family transporter [Cryobacterium sp. 5B3]
MWLPGVLVAVAAALLAGLVHALVPGVPLLTAAVVFGIVAGQLPVARRQLTGVLAPGLSVASKRIMRLGVVLLGLKLSLVDILGLGWVTIATTVAIVVLTFFGTLWFGRRIGLPGQQPLLIATGFSVCGASAIGAMSAVVHADDDDTATPIALVTLCGTLAIAVLPALWHPLGLDALQYGQWVGASVHDVGQVVATAQVAGPAALAVAIVVKLTRVLMLAPIVAGVSLQERRRDGLEAASTSNAMPLRSGTDATTRHPPIVPLFVVGFVAAVMLRTLVPVPDGVLLVADTLQTYFLATALFGLGAAVQLRVLVRTGGRALTVGLGSWALIAALAYGAVLLA